MGGALTCGSSRWKGSLRTMVFGGVVVGFARILVAEGVPLIVAGMVELRSKILAPHDAGSLFFTANVCKSTPKTQVPYVPHTSPLPPGQQSFSLVHVGLNFQNYPDGMPR